MRISEVKQAILAYRKIGKPVLITGPSGIGKTEAVVQVTQSLFGPDPKHYIAFRGIYKDPVDIHGYPYREGNIAKYTTPHGLPTEGEGILHADEILDASRQTQGAMQQLIHEGRIGDYVLPKGWYIVACGNRISDRGIAQAPPDTLVSRFGIVNMECDSKDWLKHASSQNKRGEVIAFIDSYEDLLQKHETNRKCLAYPNPRQWFGVSDILDLELEDHSLESQLIAGLVGDGAQTAFCGWLNLYRDNVSPAQIMLNPTGAKVPTNVSLLYGLSINLARRATKDNLGIILTYAKRMPKEYAQCLVTEAVRRDSELCNTREFIAWNIENQ